MTLMLVTRPEPDAQASLERLAALDIAAIANPLMTRQGLDANLPPPQGFAAMAISSTNALRALAERQALDPFRTLPLFAVGHRTAHEARLLGFTDVTSAEGTLESLVSTIALARLAGPIFYPAGKHLSGDLAHAMAPHGIMVVTAHVYEMVAETALPPAILDLLVSGGLDAVLFYSRRTAAIFCTLAAKLAVERRRQPAMLCLSENVAAPLLENHFNRVFLADHPSEEAMMALALAFAREQTGP